jgi:hypothetical protein
MMPSPIRIRDRRPILSTKCVYLKLMIRQKIAISIVTAPSAIERANLSLLEDTAADKAWKRTYQMKSSYQAIGPLCGNEKCVTKYTIAVAMYTQAVKPRGRMAFLNCLLCHMITMY